MKNEPVVSYNHMQEDTSAHTENRNPSFNLYILFAIDVLILSAIVFAAVSIIF